MQILKDFFAKMIQGLLSGVFSFWGNWMGHLETTKIHRVGAGSNPIETCYPVHILFQLDHFPQGQTSKKSLKASPLVMECSG